MPPKVSCRCHAPNSHEAAHLLFLFPKQLACAAAARGERDAEVAGGRRRERPAGLLDDPDFVGPGE